MARREVDLREGRGIDSGAQELCHTHGLLRRARLTYAVADDHDGASGAGKYLGGVLHGPTVRCGPEVAAGRRHDLHVCLAIQGVGRERQIGGPCRRRLRLVKGPTHGAGDLLRMSHLGAPLGELGHHLHQVRAAFDLLTNVLIGRGQHQRRAAFICVGQEADAVGEPAVDVQADEGRSARITSVGVRHAHCHALLCGEQIFEVRVILQLVEDRAFRSPRIAEYVFDAFGLEHLHEGLLTSHPCHGVTLLA